MSSRPDNQRSLSHMADTIPEDLTPDNQQRRRTSSVDSDISHYLHYEDNDSFFPPSVLGEKPPTSRSNDPNRPFMGER
ncbi:uncharacterized protein BDW47DRAFT_114121 [Aspergillus candidus]|uniref:Uncharacterized protein n=1 Tax=Aspergillus candidus TaxID=41067 RepID=A0A2I2EY82_ASPCN|nr:hypothetical protein BDW47DRAFT_114121 [Aspergillus candidus]PLB33329.1 hypothetical protein BDW47DRAFT_114121 [Aspergillus candidus]